MRFKAVIFDMDGTLLDTLQGLADSMNAALRRLGFPEHPVAQYRFFVGRGMDQLVKSALPEAARSAQRIEEGLALMRREYRERWPETTRLYDGVPELLDAVARAGLKAAILSNKADDFTREMSRKLLSRWPFERVRGVRPGGIRKPDPATALEIAEAFQIPPGDFFYLGDTAIDMTTARRAGMFAVGVLWGFRAFDELLDSGARLLLPRPQDLIDWLA